MKNKKLIKSLEEQGYFAIKELPDGTLCGLCRFAFTIGLMIGLDETGYYGRYCYSNLSDAREALISYLGEGDPTGPWIKYKGTGGERSRKKDIYQDY